MKKILITLTVLSCLTTIEAIFKRKYSRPSTVQLIADALWEVKDADGNPNFDSLEATLKQIALNENQQSVVNNPTQLGNLADSFGGILEKNYSNGVPSEVASKIKDSVLNLFSE